MIKLIATDIDGTILGADFEFKQSIKDCIKKLQAKGIKVVLVTGRMHCAAAKIAEELEITTPIVSYQGGLVKEIHNEENTLYQSDVNPETAKLIIKWARENNVHINLYMNDVLYVEQDNETIQRYTKARFIDYKVCSFDDLEINNVNKILGIDFTDAERVTSWVNELKEKHPNLYIVKSTPYFCEIAENTATKGCAVEFLQNLWGIKKEETLAIGDQDNDIELLNSAGVKIAMGNASEALKQCADYITDHVDNDGWVNAMEKYCL